MPKLLKWQENYLTKIRALPLYELLLEMNEQTSEAASDMCSGDRTYWMADTVWPEVQGRLYMAGLLVLPKG